MAFFALSEAVTVSSMVLAAATAVLVSVACAALFSVTSISERALRTGWRAIGFWLLATAFLVSIAIPAVAVALVLALLLELAGQLAIFRGVLREPLLTRLRQVPNWQDRTTEPPQPPPTVLPVSMVVRAGFPASALLAFLVSLPLGYPVLGITTALLLVTIGTVTLQLYRYRHEDGDRHIRHQNRSPAIAYILLALRAGLLAAYAAGVLPKVATFGSALCLLGASFFLADWAWIFIRVRPQLRTLIVFVVALAVGGTMATLGTAGAFLFLLQLFLEG